MVSPKPDFTSAEKIRDTKRIAIVLMGILVLGIGIAGCTQSSGTGPVTATGPIPSPSPTETVTVATTKTPEPVVTVIRYVSRTKDIKDSELLFSLQVPVEWNVSTHRLDNPENFVGFMYQTDLVANNTFYIHTFTDYRSREQNYRDECRRWSPVPNESAVTINGIAFDRFESTADGLTRVAYVSRKTGVNEHGYLSVLAYSTDTSKRFEKEDFEKVIASFRFYSRDDIGTMPGEEIPRIAPPVEEAGNMRSAVGGGSSSAASSSGGCSCCRG
jgi:hypothetical protein